MRIMISKFSDWEVEWYEESLHPEAVAFRNIVSQNRQHSFIFLGDGTKFEHFKADGIRFYNFRENTLISYVFSFLFKIELALLSRPTAFACMGTTNIIPLGLSSILTRAKIIPTITGDISYSVECMPKVLRKIVAFLFKAIFHKADRILALSRSIRKELIENYGVAPEKIFVYKYKISEIFNPDIPKNLKRLLNPNGPIVLTVCRISPDKGLQYLIEASRTIAKKVPNVKVIIKGSRSEFLKGNTPEKRYEGQLRKLIHEYDLLQNVTIMQGSPHSEIPEYMSAADVFVLPSISEGLGLVILEALATGVPVVASRVGGIPDVMMNEYNGLLVEPRDVEGLTKAVLRILSDDELRKRITEGGLETIRSMKENEIEDLLSRFIFNIKW